MVGQGHTTLAFEVNMARLDKEVGNSIVNESPESSEGNTDSMEECFASTLYCNIRLFKEFVLLNKVIYSFGSY